MFVPTREAFCEMTPEAFEKYSLKMLKEQTKGLENLKIEHNVVLEKLDGSYQIDGLIEFDVMGVRYTSLVECKHYKSAISREKVQVLYDKIRSTGAHKGILISTSNFQSGAIKYAKEHGIALIQITDAVIMYEIRDKVNIIMNSAGNLFNYGNPHLGVMQYAGDLGGICCSYLRSNTDYLKEFLIE